MTDKTHRPDGKEESTSTSGGGTPGKSSRTAKLPAVSGRAPAVIQRKEAEGAAAPSDDPFAMHLIDQPIRGQGSGMLGDYEEQPAPVYEKADPASKQVGTLDRGRVVKLLAEAGTYYKIDLDGVQGYVDRGKLTTAIDTPSKDKEKEFADRAAAATAAIDAAKHKVDDSKAYNVGMAPVTAGAGFPSWFPALQDKLARMTVWGAEEEEAQHVLRDYARWYSQQWPGKLPPNVAVQFEYVGRSARNDSAAVTGGNKGTSFFGGGAGAPNWCSWTSSKSVLEGLTQLGVKPSIGPIEFLGNVLKQKIGNAMGAVVGAAAYGMPLQPGDQVMFLFSTAQYGGHTATVVEDRGDVFAHVSGNSDNVAVNVSESKRMMAPPRSDFDLNTAIDSSTKEKATAATEYIKQAGFGDQVLVYSITRYGGMFAELEALANPNLPDADRAALLAKYHLTKI